MLIFKVLTGASPLDFKKNFLPLPLKEKPFPVGIISINKLIGMTVQKKNLYSKFQLELKLSSLQGKMARKKKELLGTYKIW